MLVEELKADAQAAYDAREEEFGDEVMRELERRVLLSVLDRKWREHLYEMDYLREGIGLRAYSQRDPLVEYQREGFDMFHAMMDGIKEEAVGFLFNLEVQVDERSPSPSWCRTACGGPRHRGGSGPGAGRRVVPAGHADRAPGHPRQGARRTAAAAAAVLRGSLRGRRRRDQRHAARHRGLARTRFAGASRNAECPCGSGKKYKKCHGAPGGPTGLTTRVNG